MKSSWANKKKEATVIKLVKTSARHGCQSATIITSHWTRQWNCWITYYAIRAFIHSLMLIVKLLLHRRRRRNTISSFWSVTFLFLHHVQSIKYNPRIDERKAIFLFTSCTSSTVLSTEAVLLLLVLLFPAVSDVGVTNDIDDGFLEMLERNDVELVMPSGSFDWVISVTSITSDGSVRWWRSLSCFSSFRTRANSTSRRFVFLSSIFWWWDGR